MMSKNNTILSGLIKSSERDKEYSSNQGQESIEEGDEINYEDQNNFEEDQDEEDYENESDGFVDFNALNANMLEEEEEIEDAEGIPEEIEEKNNIQTKNIENQEKNEYDDKVLINQNKSSLVNSNKPSSDPRLENLTLNSVERNTLRNLNNNSNQSLEKNKNQQSERDTVNKQVKIYEDEEIINSAKGNNTKVNKDQIINILLNSDVLPKSAQNKENSADRKKTKKSNIIKNKKFQHIESKLKKEKLESDPLYKGGPEKFYINVDLENAEYKPDMQNALRKLSKTSKNNAQSETDKILSKLLFMDIDKQKKVVDVEKVTTNDIKNKVAYYLNKKQKKIDEMGVMKDEEIMKSCSFKPELIAEKMFPEKREFNAFLEDQKNHLKKVHDKLEKMKENDLKKLELELKPAEKYSPELYNQIIDSQGGNKSNIGNRNNSQEKAYIRLYNLRNQKEKSNLLKAECLTAENKKTKKKTLEERDKYLQNLYKEGMNFIEKIESERTNKIKEEKSEMRLKINHAWDENNKFFLEKVMQIFRSLMKKSTKDDKNLYEIDEDDRFKEEEIMEDKTSLNKKELKRFLFDFGFINTDFSEEEECNNKIQNHDISEKKEEILQSQNNYKNPKEKDSQETKNKNGSPNIAMKNVNKKEKINLKIEEKKLVDLFVEQTILSQDGKISSDDLFFYVIGILMLYDYFIYSSYKKTNPISKTKRNFEQENSLTNKNYKKTKIPKTEEEKDLKNQIIQEIKEEIKKKIHTQMRYASFDIENNLIISDENANNLKKDFHMFYLNFMFKHNIKNNLNKLKNEIESNFKQQATFKPKIDENSKKLYSDYRRKLLTTENNKISCSGVDLTRSNEHSDYIDNLILRKKKKENLNALLLEQKKKDELKECTFKPNIEHHYISKKNQGENSEKENRLESLYNLGKNLIENKKIKTKEEIEKEELKLCTFKPDITKPEVKNLNNIKISNDIYHEKNYELLYKRLKEGRLERYIKESVHERGIFPQEMNVYKKKNNEEVSNINNTNKNNINETKSFEKPLNISEGRINNSAYNNSMTQIPTEENEIFNNDPDKKDAIPMLIIDVNIRPGVKKKIYVYDGDTSESLAERFSKEHDLDNETKNKLQGLIQSHMSKLLMRIDEENQSVSEKSSTYNLT